MISKSYLLQEYVQNRRSVADIARRLQVSTGKVDYWLLRHDIKKRTISEAIYEKRNPDGDPFAVKELASPASMFLFGLGIGLYWGEGTKKSLSSVRLGNSDPALVRAYIAFLTEVYQIDQKKLRFGLQIFGDMNERTAKRFWAKALNVSSTSFYKTIITPYRGVGTYRQKTKYGVITVYFNNTKLRDILVATIARLSDGNADVAQLVEHVLGGSQSPAHPKRRR